jgi:predicted permease
LRGTRLEAGQRAMILNDLRHAFRMMAARPAFTVVAILSLALGIGANTAIFSLWNRVLYASLPAVQNADDLVMLTDPEDRGLWRGTWNTREDGPRSWVTYAEFEQLRDETSVFSALMASQSSLRTWEARIDNGGPEVTHGRLVSGRFFEVLGVQPALGRVFSAAEDEGEPLYAVISHAYWQRRFAGRPDVLGKTLTLRDTAVSIIGVTPPRFVGESNGERPDVWLPLRLQPRVLPGADWLREAPLDKVMWLHVFGRLRPGVTAAQAEAQANAVFQRGLESFYGSVSSERRRVLLDQRLQLRSGARGTWATLQQFSLSLTMMFAAVAIVLLIACANLANLLLARGAARRSEMTVRMSLGASRTRLVAQFVTESVALAAVAGLAAMSVAYVLHGLLLQMLQQAENDLFVDFVLSPLVLAFALAATLVAGLAFSALPAWQLTRTAAATHLTPKTRSVGRSIGELRTGRWVVALQLALSLPMLVGAGLLVRTALNLRSPDLGFRVDRLLMATIDLGGLPPDASRRNSVLRELRLGLEQLPGVEAVTFSQLGLFSGGESTDGIRVEGSALTADGSRESAFDRVGADYVRTLGARLQRGRDIAERDRADSPKVVIVNDAFVRRFFDGRDALGKHVTTGEDDTRTDYEIVGVVGDAHTRSVRGDVEPRFLVPAEQRSSVANARTFLIRTGTRSPGTIDAVRRVMGAEAPAVSVSQIEFVDDRITGETAVERAVARLAAVFGVIALMLAALGLYGLLSYGVVRRIHEIAIRIALGAQSRSIVAMILRESAALVVAGFAAGGVLAYLGSRQIAAGLYGVAPDDPLTVGVAVVTLVVVAFAAAYLPARRASRVEPMAALHDM